MGEREEANTRTHTQQDERAVAIMDRKRKIGDISDEKDAKRARLYKYFVGAVAAQAAACLVAVVVGGGVRKKVEKKEVKQEKQDNNSARQGVKRELNYTPQKVSLSGVSTPGTMMESPVAGSSVSVVSEMASPVSQSSVMLDVNQSETKDWLDQYSAGSKLSFSNFLITPLLRVNQIRPYTEIQRSEAWIDSVSVPIPTDPRIFASELASGWSSLRSDAVAINCRNALQHQTTNSSLSLACLSAAHTLLCTLRSTAAPTESALVKRAEKEYEQTYLKLLSGDPRCPR